jgi:hypothetical protein
LPRWLPTGRRRGRLGCSQVFDGTDGRLPSYELPPGDRACLRARGPMTSCTPPNPSQQGRPRPPSRFPLGQPTEGAYSACPSQCPSTVMTTTNSVFDIMLLKCSGAKGTRTPGLLHAMGNRPGSPSETAPPKTLLWADKHRPGLRQLLRMLEQAAGAGPRIPRRSSLVRDTRGRSVVFRTAVK